MGITLDIFKRGNYVENPYQNFFEIRAKDLDKKLVSMQKYSKNIILVVNISPFDKNFDDELKNLINLKNNMKDEDFEILIFPSSQIDNIELSDLEMKEKLLSNDILKENLTKLNVFNRVYVNGEEVCEVLKYCYRNSPLFMFREGKSKIIKDNFSKFLISKNGQVHSYYNKGNEYSEVAKNISYLLSQRIDNNRIREDFINYNKFH